MSAAPASARPDLFAPIGFAEIGGWGDDDHAAALRAFQAGSTALLARPPKSRLVAAAALRALALRANELGENVSRAAAREFFERHFIPQRIISAGFVTGYYEPELPASRRRSEEFSVPLYRRPEELVEVREADRPAAWDQQLTWGLATPAGLLACPDRAAIEAGALSGRGLELVWVQSAVDVFFVHVQGSARLRFADGGVMRIAFDGKSGHPYTSIGRLAVARGLLTPENAHKDGLEALLRSRLDVGRGLMRANRSFIFFRETGQADDEGPIGAAGVPLVAGRSLAVDRAVHTFHTPIFVDASELADPASEERPWRRLTIAHDTGSAIVGPARGDLFFGSGDRAGSLAGRVRHAATMILLWPVAEPP